MIPISIHAIPSTLLVIVALCGLHRPALSPPVFLSPDSAGHGLAIIPPAELGPFVRVLHNGVNVESRSVDSGYVQSMPPDTVRFSASHGGEFLLGFSLPPGLGVGLKKVTNMPGWLFLNTRLSPDSSRQTVVVRVGSTLLAAYTWQFSEKPVSLDLGDGMRLAQTISGVAVLRTREGITPVRVGTPVEIRSGAQRFTVFVHTSIVQRTPARYRGGDIPSGYVLRALVLAE